MYDILEVVKSDSDNALMGQGNITAQLLEQFFDFLDVSAKTAQTYRRAIRRFLVFVRENNVIKPSRADILAFKKGMEAKGKSPATAHLYLSAIRRFFQWTEQSGLYPDVTANVKAPRQERGHKKDYFVGAQIKSILGGIDRNSTEGLRNYALLALMTTGGLRTIEVIRADVGDIRAVGGVSVLFIQGKGRSDKKDFVKLMPEVEAAIRDYLKTRGQVEAEAPLFASVSKRNRGQRMTTRTISGICKAAMRAAGFDSDRLTAHSLRHSAVTLALLSGQTLEEVQHFARHSNISTTQIYAHNIDRMKSQCEAAIANAIF